MLILLLFTYSIIKPQSFLYDMEIGSFNSAYSFSINPAGFLYVSDASSNEIIKLDTLGNVIKTIGGYGWNNASFDFPSDVFATTLNVYVADKFNDRIQIFDKDLNFISSLSSNSIDNELYNFRYPTGIGVSEQGDMFLLDSDNSRILKFSSSGKFILQIGNYEAGNFALTNPKVFTVINNKIFVIDNQRLLIFDLYGNNISTRNLDFIPVNINSTFYGITINSSNKIYYSFLKNKNLTIEFNVFEPKINEVITDSLIFNNKLYILTSNKIFIYKIVEQDFENEL